VTDICLQIFPCRTRAVGLEDVQQLAGLAGFVFGAVGIALYSLERQAKSGFEQELLLVKVDFSYIILYTKQVLDSS
jgi:hypothetical protein